MFSLKLLVCNNRESKRKLHSHELRFRSYIMKIRYFKYIIFISFIPIYMPQCCHGCVSRPKTNTAAAGALPRNRHTRLYSVYSRVELTTRLIALTNGWHNYLLVCNIISSGSHDYLPFTST